jgi:hypothetical protein
LDEEAVWTLLCNPCDKVKLIIGERKQIEGEYQEETPTQVFFGVSDDKDMKLLKEYFRGLS